MATSGDDIKTRFHLLSKSAVLDLIVPQSSDFDSAALLNEGRLEDVKPAQSRRNLFLDERSTVILILKTPTPQDQLRQLLPSLEIVVAAHATDAVPQGAGNAALASGKHDLTSKTFPAADVEDVISVDGQTYVIWQTTVHLTRPRTRLQRPAIYFTANLTIQAQALASVRKRESIYLKSYEPLPANVLEPLRYDPTLGDSEIYLSGDRITKVIPSAPRAEDVVKPVRAASKRALPTVPALFSRIRYSALSDAIVASLHVETSQVITGTVSVNDAHLELPGASVTHLTNTTLPMTTLAGDETVLLYRIRPHSTSLGPSVVTVNINAIVSSDQCSDVPIEIVWQAQIDLSQLPQKPVYKWSRPISTASSHGARLSAQFSNSRPASVDGPQKPVSGDDGITFTFTGPKTVQRHQKLELSVQCINRSRRARRFALVVLQPRKLRTTTFQRPPSASEDANLIANIFQAPPLDRPKPPDVLDLNPDVKIGPLPPGACFETTMSFTTVATGVLDLGAIRIVDLETRQTVDVKDLPNVISLD